MKGSVEAKIAPTRERRQEARPTQSVSQNRRTFLAAGEGRGVVPRASLDREWDRVRRDDQPPRRFVGSGRADGRRGSVSKKRSFRVVLERSLE